MSCICYFKFFGSYIKKLGKETSDINFHNTFHLTNIYKILSIQRVINTKIIDKVLYIPFFILSLQNLYVCILYLEILYFTPNLNLKFSRISGACSQMWLVATILDGTILETLNLYDMMPLICVLRL